MAYTDSWASLEAIAGTTPANQIDDKFRARFLGIKERMNEIFVDWTADPVVLKDSVSGKVVGKPLMIPHNLFTERVSVGSLSADRGLGFTHVLHDSGVMDAPIVLPAGVTIKLVEILFNIGSGATVTWEVFSFDFTTSAPAKSNTGLVSPTVFSTAGFQLVQSAVLSAVVDAQRNYYVSFDVTSVSGEVNVYGARITYDTPSSQQTY